MTNHPGRRLSIALRRFQYFLGVLAVVVFASVAIPAAQAAINWDGQAGTNLWFDPVNWSFAAPGGSAPFYLPPSNGNSFQAREAVVNGSPAGDGVVYDPLGADAANYAAAAAFDYPTEEDARFDRDAFWRFYVSTSGATTDNKVTLKSGTMEFIDKATSLNATGTPDGGSLNSTVIIGRGGASAGIKGTFVQEGGSFLANEVALDIGHFQTNVGNGIYEYKGGILEVSLVSDNGMRLGHGGSTGPAGNGSFSVHDSAQPGRIRTWILNVASGLGATGSASNGSGTIEFHADSNGTRPIQVLNNLSINHQNDSAGTSGNKRSAVLKLALDAAPQVDGSGVPINLGLIDVDSDANGVGDIVGVTDDALNPFVGEDDIFYSDTWDHGGLPLTEGSIISADFGSTRYNWQLSYNGTITWADADTSQVGSISANLVDPDDPAIDVVLIGLSSEAIGPQGVPGDYNQNNIVDAADYTVWRNKLGSGTSLPNDDSPGVGLDDFDRWKANFGMQPGAGSGGIYTAQVPEPAACLWFAGFACSLLVFRYRTAQNLDPGPI